MKIKCSCGKVYKLSSEMAGKKVQCKQCQRKFVVPTPKKKHEENVNPMPEPAGAAPHPYTVGQASYRPTSPRGKTSPKKTKSSRSSKAAREQALLSQYTGDSLEGRMVSRRKDRIEEGRVSNGLIFVLKGLGMFVAAAVLFYAFHMIDEHGLSERRGGRRRGLIILLYYLKGKYWVPPLVALIGLHTLYLGIGSITGHVDIDDQDDLPEQNW